MNITKKLLEMMDSHLEVASVYGEGSEFSYTVEQEVLNSKPTPCRFWNFTGALP